MQPVLQATLSTGAWRASPHHGVWLRTIRTTRPQSGYPGKGSRSDTRLHPRRNDITDMRRNELPFIFETAKFHEKQTSVLPLDEYIIIRATMGVSLKREVQCSFGALSSKPTSWLYFMVNMDDMPDACKHPRVNWYSDMTNSVRGSSHPLTSGKVTYISTPRTAEQLATLEARGPRFRNIGCVPSAPKPIPRGEASSLGHPSSLQFGPRHANR